MSMCFYVTNILVNDCVFGTCICGTIFNLLIVFSEAVSNGSNAELVKNWGLLSLIFLLSEIDSGVETFNM